MNMHASARGIERLRRTAGRRTTRGGWSTAAVKLGFVSREPQHTDPEGDSADDSDVRLMAPSGPVAFVAAVLGGLAAAWIVALWLF